MFSIFEAFSTAIYIHINSEIFWNFVALIAEFSAAS